MRRLGILGTTLLLACSGGATTATHSSAGGETMNATSGPTFAEDAAFLRAHVPDLIVLRGGDARVAVAPEYQGRVMTSGTSEDGPSFGWIHRERIASDEMTPHMNAFGGEDRFWLGPEGGPFALYFPPGRRSNSSTGRCPRRSTAPRGRWRRATTRR